jgi:hypothetical protein
MGIKQEDGAMAGSSDIQVRGIGVSQKRRLSTTFDRFQAIVSHVEPRI